MNGFKKIIEFKYEKMEIAKKHYSLKIFKIVIELWRYSIKVDLVGRQRIADEFNKRLLLKHGLSSFKLYKQHAQIEAAKANRFYKYHIKQKLFESWRTYKSIEKRKAKEHEVMIENHNKNRVLKTYFLIWKKYPSQIKRQKERQKRMDELRSKVKEFIPDFESPASTNNSTSTNN
jgi:hypothetical protein